MATGRLPDPNTAPLTAKGDLYTYSTRGDRLAVGSNGDTLVADSSATTGLRWQGNFAAGKNKIINGDFNINQRNFTSNTTTATYNFDRFLQVNGGSSGTLTITPQTFTPGSAPLSGYEARNFVRCVTASGASTNTYALFQQTIESVRTLAGQTATISFWAKAGSGTPKIAVEMEQYFGSGGSPSAAVTTYAGQVTLSTSWARYSVTVSIPSISGKTIGTSTNDLLLLSLWLSGGSDFNARTGSLGLQNATFDIWGVQVEAGSVATAFQTATGTLAGELAACKRYLPSISVPSTSTTIEYFIGYAALTNTSIFTIPFDVQARVAPTGITVSGQCQAVAGNTSTNVTPTFDAAGANAAGLLASHTITQGQGARLIIPIGGSILFTGCEL